MSSVDTRPVPVSIFRWPKIKGLTTRQKFLYAYLYFNPDASASGCYLFGIESAAADLGIASSNVEDELGELCKRDLVSRDKDTGEIFVTDWPRWHRFNTPAALGALRSSVDRIQSQRLGTTVRKAYESTLSAAKGKEKGNGKAKASALAEEALAHRSPAAAAPRGISPNVRSVSPGGIWCWTDQDSEQAQSLEERHGVEKILEVTKVLENQGIEPLPSRVLRSIKLNTDSAEALPHNWWDSEQGTLIAAEVLDIEAWPGEKYNDLRQRIWKAIKR